MRLIHFCYCDTNPTWSKAEALRQAQLRLMGGTIKVSGEAQGERAEIVSSGTQPDLAGQPPFKFDSQAPYAHPFYWAPFILIGNWR